jgi:hypothetical protein
MAGWIMVAPQGCEQEHDLRDSGKKGIDFARSLPAK